MNLASILNQSAQELLLQKDFEKLAEEAAKASEIVEKHFSHSFGLGKTEIPAFHIERYGEYYGDPTLNINGIWHFTDNWGGGNSYEVSCSIEGIYKCYRAHYLKEKKLYDFIPEEERHNADVAQEFRKFISELEEKS